MVLVPKRWIGRKVQITLLEDDRLLKQIEH
ncbi:MAG: DUF2080 family transposase-associated protein [Methanobrevibacter sp.]|nr:DUF2080 family transposase-associated protein [Methanobrevibacter sp.]